MCFTYIFYIRAHLHTERCYCHDESKLIEITQSGRSYLMYISQAKVKDAFNGIPLLLNAEGRVRSCF
jgi:hypothetical protein